MSEFRWSWVRDSRDTLKASLSIDKGSISLIGLKTPDKGILKASEIKASIDSANASITQVWRTWTSTIKPILDSLPAGARDNRWREGRGLPSKIDALIYGIQGTTLFVFNDATSANADGRYWHSVDSRPKTIAEAIEDIWSAVSDLSLTTVESSTSNDLEPLWTAIGHYYKDPALTSVAGSLDIRTGNLEGDVADLTKDIFEGFARTPGALTYTLAKHLDALLKIHEVSGGWGEDPDLMDHAFTPGAHNHAYTDITPVPASNLTQNRVGSVSSLYNDVLRLRYEIAAVKGVNWDLDAVSPFVGTPATSLQSHINYVGAGTPSTSNPHGLDYTNVGVVPLFENVSGFIGMTDFTDNEMPNYSSSYYLTQSTSLATAIGALDTAFHTYLSSGEVIRATYEYDRSAMSEEERLTTPIVVTHNTGKKPILSILDASPEEYYGGEYTSPLDLNIVHVNSNQFQVWTGAAIVEIIALY
jgi:hypothetical protein